MRVLRSECDCGRTLRELSGGGGGALQGDHVAGQLLDRVLEHEFDTKHYRIDPGGVNAEVREGLKVLEYERTRWEKETREKAEEERQEQQHVREMQRKAGRGT